MLTILYYLYTRRFNKCYEDYIHMKLILLWWADLLAYYIITLINN